MRNTHERVIDASASTVGALLEDLGQAGDRIWPSPAWVPMKLDRPVEVGADGGHGPIRYHVTEYEPGRRIRFDFHERTGVTGFHEFTVEALGPDRCLARHHMDVDLHGMMRVLFPAAIESMHDAVLEDLLDNLERAATGTVSSPATWSPWARACWILGEQSPPRAVPIPLRASLIRGLYARPDLEDAWQVTRRPGMSDDPEEWAVTLFGESALFPIVSATDHEALVGSDLGHMSFRASVLVDTDSVTLSSAAIANNRWGKVYLVAVSIGHPFVVRSLLRRASRTMALQGSGNRRIPLAPG